MTVGGQSPDDPCGTGNLACGPWPGVPGIVHFVQTPQFVGIGEIMTMLGLSKTRVHQLVERADFPPHYLRLQMGRLWLTQHVVDWAMNHNRPVTMPRYLPEPLHSTRIPFALSQVSASRASRQVPRSVPGGLSEAPGDPLIKGTDSLATISSGEEQEVDEVGAQASQKTQPPKLASLASSVVVATPPIDPEPPNRRTAQELNKLALAEDWDTLERIYETAKAGNGTDLPESDLQLLGFAAMVILNHANVPNYRRTKEQMIRAWNELRRAYEPTPTEVIALAQHLVITAQTPFVPGAVKKFSDFEIARLRRQAPKTDTGKAQVHRWQGAHGSHEELISKMTPEQRKRFGVDPR